MITTNHFTSLTRAAMVKDSLLRMPRASEGVEIPSLEVKAIVAKQLRGRVAWSSLGWERW